mgnify:CR=1 FL=1
MYFTYPDDFFTQEYKDIDITVIEDNIYRIIQEFGPDHDKTFTVQLKVQDIIAEGVGKSKKLAEQDAARKALDILNL